MPCIFRDGRLAIYIYADDHAPPHFRLRSPNSGAQIEIATMRVLRGTADRVEYAEAVAWAEANRNLLMEKWWEFNERD